MSCWEWLELAESGRLYEHFGGDREQVKQEFIYLMFGRRPLCSFPVGRQIQAEFLEVAEAIEALKRRNILAKNDDPRPYRYMACLLQLYESTLMIYRVCGRILKERPDVPIWTVHDCVMTEQRHKEYVKGIILEEFAFVGIVPSIKEDWL